MNVNDKKITFEQSNMGTMPTKFDIHKRIYDKFQKDMEKSDLGQGYTRYIQEFYILETLGKYAMEDNNPEHIKFVRENAARVSQKLQDSFGITIQNEILDKI